MGFWFENQSKGSKQERAFFINEAPEQQQPSGYQKSPRAIVWMSTMTQQGGVKQRSAELQARSSAGPDKMAQL